MIRFGSVVQRYRFPSRISLIRLIAPRPRAGVFYSSSSLSPSNSDASVSNSDRMELLMVIP